jgi:hypothetical protein
LGGGVHLRVWAPRCREVVVEIEGLEPAALQPETDGKFSLRSVPARAGAAAGSGYSARSSYPARVPQT